MSDFKPTLDDLTHNQDKTMSETKTLLKFPCDFPIKVMGKPDNDFTQLVYRLIKKHCPELQSQTLKTRPSSKGKYVALTVHIEAQSQQQLDAIYQDLSDNSQVLMAL